MINLSSVKKPYFVGIGGIGVSAIAKLFLLQGKGVTGSDVTTATLITEQLKESGAIIYDGHQASQVPAGTDLLVYSPAIPETNPERQVATKLGITQLSYPEVLGLISADKFTIAVAGTHGKTTTTAMIAQILVTAKLDPTVIVGSLLSKEKTNLLVGRGKPASTRVASSTRGGYFVVEACEYRRSFLNLSPQILVITNIDNDHLDYYKDLADIQSAFAELAAKLPADGLLISDQSVMLDTRCLTVDYRKVDVSGLRLKVPGQHNIKNAQAALAVARALGIEDQIAIRALNEFAGTWRRFEYKGETEIGAKVYDDYAHHPTEIIATLQGARELFPEQKIIVVFQPHLYSRTKLLFNDFLKSFDGADEVLILPIYAAREEIDPSIDSRDLVRALEETGKIKSVKYFADFVTAEHYLIKNLKKADVVLTMGAGDIFVLGEKIVYNQ